MCSSGTEWLGWYAWEISRDSWCVEGGVAMTGGVFANSVGVEGCIGVVCADFFKSLSLFYLFSDIPYQAHEEKRDHCQFTAVNGLQKWVNFVGGCQWQ